MARQPRPAAAQTANINFPMALLILVIMIIYVTMVYGPIATFLVELFPTRIRYTAMSLPYHIGNGWFDGLLSLRASAMVARSGQHPLRPPVSHRRGGDQPGDRCPFPARQSKPGYRALKPYPD